MLEIKYTAKIWFSGLLLTPVVYVLLLTIFSGFHFPVFIDKVTITFIIPYAFLISIWMILGLLATIQLSNNTLFIKRNLSIAGFLMPFAAMLMINSISALQSYGGGYLLAFAYAICTILFVWLYQSDLSVTRSKKIPTDSIKDSIIYGLTVWLFTFLLSTPVSVLVWIVTKDFKSIFTFKTARDILDRYSFQFSLSIAYFITIALITLITINLDIAKNQKKAIIFIFAFPISFPVLFYYLLFSGEIFTHRLAELFMLIFPSTIISALSIWLIDITPGARAKN
jgi:hypothetical protein